MGERVRYAPSPSGYLHIGGARTALFSWLWARRTGGKFVVRVEDTDAERSSLESVQAILDALRWLGLDWDEGPEVGGPVGPYFQSERRDRYREAAETLISGGHAYRCYCTKEELDGARAALKAENPKAQFVYPGTCRNRRDQPDLPWVVRFESPAEGETAFVDKVFGRIATPNSQLQDFVLLRQNGYPLYNFACVIDDHDMGMTLVARGRDHIGNTPQQVLLYAAFGWDMPEFAHLPLMLAQKGEKLSKRNASVAVQDYRERGFTPAAVLNYIARFGWSYGDREIFSRAELAELFDWSRVSKSDGKFDERKFADVAFEHLKRPELTSDAEYCEAVLPFLCRRGLEPVSMETLRAALPLIRERAHTLVDAAHHLDFFLREAPELDEKAVSKFLRPEAAPGLVAVEQTLAGVEEFTAPALEQAVARRLEADGVELKTVAQPLRVALTGRSASPPLFDVMAVLGRERSLGRVRRAVELAAGQQ
ncbi:MAG TPA: glutamate--tRNA ligase [Polyangiaceae bacterium]